MMLRSLRGFLAHVLQVATRLLAGLPGLAQRGEWVACDIVLQSLLILHAQDTDTVEPLMVKGTSKLLGKQGYAEHSSCASYRCRHRHARCSTCMPAAARVDTLARPCTRVHACNPHSCAAARLRRQCSRSATPPLGLPMSPTQASCARPHPRAGLRRLRSHARSRRCCHACGQVNRLPTRWQRAKLSGGCRRMSRLCKCK